MLLLLMFNSFKWTSAPMAAGRLSNLLLPEKSVSLPEHSISRRLKTVMFLISKRALGRLISAFRSYFKTLPLQRVASKVDREIRPRALMLVAQSHSSSPAASQGARAADLPLRSLCPFFNERWLKHASGRQ